MRQQFALPRWEFLMRRQLCCVVGLLAFSAVVQAASFTEALVTGPAGTGCTEFDTNGGLVTAACTSIFDNVTSTATAKSVASGGHLGASIVIDTHAQNSNAAGGFTGTTTARTVDRVRIDGINGEQGQGLLSLSVSLAAQQSAVTQATGPSAVTLASTGTEVRAILSVAGEEHYMMRTGSYRVDWRPETGPIGSGDDVSYIDGVTVPSAFGLHTFTIPFSFGSEFTISMELRGYATAGAAGDGQASIDFDAMNSFDWRGIQRVSAGGQEVPFTLTSESGIDWVSPVPEPETAWLFVVGLVSCAALAARKRSGAGHR
tara:strand:+ start:266 stop:1213 length:948 start_codon:yes stop_codon:yes gene_type:complete